MFSEYFLTHQAPLSMGFFKWEYWSGLPFPIPGDLPDLGIEPRPPALQADSLSYEPPGKPEEYWSRLPWPPPGHLPNPGTEPRSSALQADSLLSEPPGKPFSSWKDQRQGSKNRRKKKKPPIKLNDIFSFKNHNDKILYFPFMKHPWCTKYYVVIFTTVTYMLKMPLQNRECPHFTDDLGSDYKVIRLGFKPRSDYPHKYLDRRWSQCQMILRME